MQKLEFEKNIKAITFENVGLFFPKKPRLFHPKQNGEGHWALQNISFEINRGDVLGIIGNNGAGKSTTLALVGGIISPTEGTINTYNNRAALLSINSGFMTSLSGRKNIILLGLSLGVQKKVILDAMDDIISFSELEDFIEEPVETYSSGMKARLGFSTAIMLEPEILLIDEVLGVGDRNFKTKSSDIMKKKLQDNNSTAILVSHTEATILSLTNKAIWLEKGKTMAFGLTPEVMKEYIAFCEKRKS